MPKFLVRVSGENFQCHFSESKWIFWKNNYTQKVGFLTTRFIEEESANEAIEKVFNLIKKELKVDDCYTRDSNIELVEIQENIEAFDENAPGGEFTFFVEDE